MRVIILLIAVLALSACKGVSPAFLGGYADGRAKSQALRQGDRETYWRLRAEQQQRQRDFETQRHRRNMEFEMELQRLELQKSNSRRHLNFMRPYRSNNALPPLGCSSYGWGGC